MHIGIDARPVGTDGSGNERYLRGIVGGLQVVCQSGERLLLAGSDRAALAELAATTTETVSIPRGPLGVVGLGRSLRRAGATVAVGHYHAPVGFGGPVATVVHDVAYLRVPETFPFALRSRVGWSVRRSVRVSDLVVTVSQFSRTELCDAYPFLDVSRVVVTYNAPSRPFTTERSEAELADVRGRYRLPETFVLAVGNFQPRKNLLRLGRAVAKLDAPLVLVGQPGWKHHEIVGQMPATARWLGYVPEGDLACLYRLCAVFAYPSLYEGYGLPVIEAMAAGAPVVTSATSALPEVTGGAALLVEPTDVDAISEAVGKLLADRRAAQALAARGRARAAQFSWDASAAALLTALRGIAPDG